MTKFRFYTADVFTDVPFGGNQLAVFPDATGIPEQWLAAITREFNFSETTFVYPPADPAHTRRVRIFTPGAELPFAGHPTVGTAHVLAHTGAIPLTGDTTHIVFEEGVGPIPVSIRAQGGLPVFAQLSVAMLPRKGPPPPPGAELARVLGLHSDDVLGGDWGAEGFTCGVPYVMVALRDRDAVARAQLHMDAWAEVLRGAWSAELFVFAMEGERPGSDVRARMFAPGLNVPEDPATGSACAAFAGYLAARDPTRDGTLRWRIEQGFEMGRPSLIDVEADVRAGAVTGVRVGGSTVMMTEGSMEIPA